MAFKSVFPFSVLFLFTYCEAKPENCSDARCKLSPVGEGFVSEFRRKANEKGVRLVYLNIIIGNDSYDPLELQDVFLPRRWVWANTINEPMLSLPDDYDILSLGLLTYQVQSMDVHLEDQPSGCLANLNSTCQNLAVGRMLLENVTMGSSDELLSDETRVVCVAVIKSVDSNQHDINYHCCGVHKETNSTSILCDLAVDRKWFTGFDGITLILAVFMIFFIPALPLALPDGVFSLRRECCKENRSEQRNNAVGPADQQHNTGEEDQQNMQAVSSGQDESDYSSNEYEQREEESQMIPVDDASPITFSSLLLECSRTVPDVGLSFNIKFFLVNMCVFPCVIYLRLGLYNMLKATYINESIKKRVSLSNVFVLGSTFITFEVGELIWFIALTFSSLIILLFLRPSDLVLAWNLCPICCKDDEDRWGSQADHTLSYEMRIHFKILHHNLWKVIFNFAKLVTWDIFLPPCKNSRQASRTMHPIYVLLRSFSILFTLLLRVVCGAISFPFFLVYSLFVIMWYSPALLFFLWFAIAIQWSIFRHSCDNEDENDSDDDEDKDDIKILNCYMNWFGRILAVFLGTGFFFYSFIMGITVSCNFINKALGYTIAGLVLNEDVITPYVAFFLVVTTNIYLCYANMQAKYKEVKEMILKWQNELHINSGDPEGTIRKKLFWFVCDRVLPIKSEICRTFRNMVLILVFLYLVVYSVVFFGNEYKASAVFSTIYVFVGGLIPALVFKGLTKGKKFIGWAKIRIEREIETAVAEYRNSEDIELGWHSTGNDTIVNYGFRPILRNQWVRP